MVGLLVAAALSVSWCLAAIRIGPSMGFVDHPDDPELKAHDRPAVQLGGVGVFAGVHVALAITGILDVGLLVATSLVLVLGLLDDRWDLSPLLRLAVEVAAGLTLVALASTPLDSSSFADLVVGVVLVVVVINAVNLFDGLDGLVGGSGLVAALGLAALAGLRGADATFGLVLAGALGGFLAINWHPARVFLGDNGAYTVGVFLAYGVLTAGPDGLGTGLGIALLCLGVFGLDLVATVIRRRLAGRPLFAGDRSHVYDQLHDRGMPVPTVALASAVVQGFFVTIALLLHAIDPGPWTWLILTGLGATAMALLALAGFLRPTPRGQTR